MARSPDASPPCVRSFLLAVGMLVLLGCVGEEKAADTNVDRASPSSDTTAPMPDDTTETTGTVRYVDLEGGFYGLVDDDGAKYDASPLPDSLQEDGLRVRFRVTEKEMMTTRMWGTPVELLSITPIEEDDG